MNGACCQAPPRGGDRARPPTSQWRLGRAAAGWLGPGVTLVLLPKCPACVAAYVGLATGLGMSLSAAAHLRRLIILLCLVSLAFVAARQLRRFFERRLIQWRAKQSALAEQSE